MRKIVEFKVGEDIPEDAVPIGVVRRLVPAKIAGAAPDEELGFFYDVPQYEVSEEVKEYVSARGRKI